MNITLSPLLFPGLQAEGITPDQIASGAGAANIQNGVGSAIKMSSLYATSPVASVVQAGKGLAGTVGTKLAEPGVDAISQLGRPNIWINPSQFLNDPNFNLATIVHEVIHNVTGVTDGDLYKDFGITKANPKPSDITNAIEKKCF